MIIQFLKKFYTKLCVILLCVYIVLLLDSMTKHDATVEITTINNPILPISSTKHWDISEELKQRRATIQKLCDRRPLNESRFILRPVYTKVLSRLYVDRKHKLTWCPTYKAASSTIMKLFASLGGLLSKEMELKLQNQEIQIERLTRGVFTSQAKNTSKVVEASNRLLVVRHPFARILSAFRDKLEHRKNREYYYQKIGKYIVKKFGNQKKQVEPSFVDFLKAIVQKFPFDEHWRPYFVQCAPCLFDYNLILKTEFLSEELKHILTSLHLADHFPKAMNMNANGTTDNQIIEKYYSSVPAKLLRKVYEIYRFDFELFQYSPLQYFKMSRS